jgi:phage baseplate assembly protein W
MAYKNIEINDATSVEQTVVKQSQFYKGFSTVDNSTSATELYDFALIKQDIINHFNTRKGERVMNPQFGSDIWDILMEPNTDLVRQELTNDIENICNFDSRVVPVQIDITEYDSGYILDLTLLLKNTDHSANWRLAFDQNIGLAVRQQ